MVALRSLETWSVTAPVTMLVRWCLRGLMSVIVAASLAAIPLRDRADAKRVFSVFALVAEDTHVPLSAFRILLSAVTGESELVPELLVPEVPVPRALEPELLERELLVPVVLPALVRPLVGDGAQSLAPLAAAGGPGGTPNSIQPLSPATIC